MPGVTYKAQLMMDVDTNLPRDRMVITPTFTDNGATSDPTQLATDLATGYATWLGGTPHVTCKLYDVQGTPPVFPAGIFEKNPAGAPVATTHPREVAICLSYYAGVNRPRRRGRLYIPAGLVLKHTAESSASVRPTTATMNGAMDLAGLFKGLGGVDVDWVVWSTVDRAPFKVTNYYVDDEWDTVRRRGMRPTTRVTGTGS